MSWSVANILEQLGDLLRQANWRIRPERVIQCLLEINLSVSKHTIYKHTQPHNIKTLLTYCETLLELARRKPSYPHKLWARNHCAIVKEKYQFIYIPGLSVKKVKKPLFSISEELDKE